jgi:hypothetical protein
MSKTLKRMRKEVGMFTGIGVTGVVGTRVLSSVSAGTTMATTVPRGVSNIMGQMPLLGTIKGAGYTLGLTREALSMPKSRKRKRRY